MSQPLPEVNDKIRFFFTVPGTNPVAHIGEGGGLVSVLYLLRRELIETSGHDPNTATEDDVLRLGARKRLFATMILAFTVIDLLAKFVSEKNGVGARFKEFLAAPDGGGLVEDTAKLLWAARNSLVHQFNVPAEDDRELKELNMRFVGFAQRLEKELSIGKAQSIVVQQGDRAIIFVDGILALTFSAIKSYENSLYGSESGAGRARFRDAYDKYARISMGRY